MAENKSQFNKAAYDREYQKKHFTRVSVVLHKEHDSDIIKHLSEQHSKSDYIKQLIRKDING